MPESSSMVTRSTSVRDIQTDHEEDDAKNQYRRQKFVESAQNSKLEVSVKKLAPEIDIDSYLFIHPIECKMHNCVIVNLNGRRFLKKSDHSLLEINTIVERQNNSMLCGDYINDSKLYIFTPFDRTFMILPYLLNDKYVSLAQILPPQLEFMAEADIESVADSKAEWHVKVWRRNDTKVLAWLRAKVGRITAAILDTESIHPDPSLATQMALDILQEYLDPMYVDLLCKEYNVSPALPKEPLRLSCHKWEVDRVSADIEMNLPTMDAQSKQATKANIRTKKKLVMTSTKGMKSMTSFFAPRSQSEHTLT